MNQKVSEVIEDMRRIVPKGNVLKFDFVRATAVRLIDEVDLPRLAEVVINIIDNAIKFTDVGTITVSTNLIDANKERAARISIRDTGTGIDHLIIPHLFKKFVSKSDYGTGLGLFNVAQHHRSTRR